MAANSGGMAAVEGKRPYSPPKLAKVRARPSRGGHMRGSSHLPNI